MNNQVIILVSILAILIVSFVSAGWFWGNKDPSLAPSKEIIDANQCAADGTCEMNNGKVTGNLQVLGNLTVNGNFGMDCAVLDVLLNINGHQACANAGYDSCIAQETTMIETYYSSISGGCSGNIQAEMEESTLHSCSNIVPIRGCGSYGYRAAEPYLGDYDERKIGRRALCCR